MKSFLIMALLLLTIALIGCTAGDSYVFQAFDVQAQVADQNLKVTKSLSVVVSKALDDADAAKIADLKARTRALVELGKDNPDLDLALAAMAEGMKNQMAQSSASRMALKEHIDIAEDNARFSKDVSSQAQEFLKFRMSATEQWNQFMTSQFNNWLKRKEK